MQVQQFTAVADFLTQAEEYLLAQESRNGLALGLCRALQQGRYQEHPPLLAVVRDDQGRPAATAVRTPPHNLVVYSHQEACQPAMAALAGALAGETLPGVFGPAAVARAFADARQRPYRPGMRQGAYELRRVIPPPQPPPGQMRPAGPDDKPWLVDWVAGFHEDALSAITAEQAAEVVDRHLGAETLFLWQDGRPVSMAAKTRETRHGRTVSLVYTPPAWRGRGYATALVAALSQRLLDEGYAFCTLFTDLANPTSNHIYQKIGYEWVAEFHVYTFTD